MKPSQSENLPQHSVENAFSLTGKIALVTGAGRGIGRGIATVLLEAGATVAVNARSNAHLGKLVEGLEPIYGNRVVGLAGDVATADGARAIIGEAIEKVGDLDILVNGVGDAIFAKLVDETGDTNWGKQDDETRNIIDLNMMSAIHCARAIGPTMIRRRRGRVVNIAGVLGGIRGLAGMSLYSAGKAGLMGFTKSLAREWAPHGVTVNAVAPGIFPDKNNLSETEYNEIERAYLNQIPIGRFGDVREIGQLVLYLVCDASSYITGQLFVMDGGLSA